jgi:PEP-CTERM motif
MKKFLAFLTVMMFFATAGMAQAQFVNGDFETGNASGWTTGSSGYRANLDNSQLNPATFLPGGLLYNTSPVHSAIVTPGPDPNVGSLLNSVYSGNYSYRVEDTTFGGYASAIKQTVTNWKDNNIFFAWAAVLEGAHGTNDAATFILTLHDDTKNIDIVKRQYNAASGGGGVDQRFLTSGNYFYTPWQVEQLDTSAYINDTLTLSLLAADCQPTGHAGYVYLDGFGNVTPPPVTGVPEPATMILLGLGLAGLATLRKKI